MTETVRALKPSQVIQCNEAIGTLAWSKQGALAVGSHEGDIQLLVSGASTPKTLKGHVMGTFALQWWGEDILISGGGDGFVRRWSLTDNSSTSFSTEGNKDWIEHLALSPDENFLAVAAGSQVSLWDKESKCIRQYPKFTSTVADICWHPRGKFLATVSNGQVCFWRVGNNSPVNEFNYASSMLVGAWSPKGDWFAVGCQDASVHLWITATGKDLFMSGFPRKIRELDFHLSGRWMAVGGSPEITLWDFCGDGPAGTTPKQFQGHKDYVSDLAFSPDGKWLGSTGEDGLFLLWEIEGSNRPVAGYKSEAPLTHLNWRSDSRVIVVGGEEGKAAIISIV
jgi:WD40 repeat protein